MNTKPILFSGPMVRAILDGSKTQTRRAVKPQTAILTDKISRGLGVRPPASENQPVIACPYGKPGDTLWVKETSRLFDDGDDTFIQYRADMEMLELPSDWYSDDPVLARWISAQSAKPKMWRPSILMPQRASRITLKIEAVRVERLRDIESAPLDIVAEGMPSDTRMGDIQWYRDLWQSINGIASWNANPFVWVITFKRIKP